MFRIAALAFLASTLAGQAQNLPSTVASADLDPGWRQGATHVAGLTISLAPGWKTYWRAPGDAGIPPQFNWSGSENIRAVHVQFPVPEIMDQNGMRSIGYHDGVTFPLWIETEDPGAPIRLRGEIDLGVCEDICIPVTLRVAGELSATKAQKSGSLSQAINDRPDRVDGMACDIRPIADGLRLVARVDLPRAAGAEVAVIEAGNPEIWVSPPVTHRKGATLTAEVEMVPPTAQPFALARADVRMTVLAGGRAVELIGCN